MSQYELAMPPKVCLLKLEWLLASYAPVMVHKLLVYLAWVTLAEGIRKWPSLSTLQITAIEKELDLELISSLFLIWKFSRKYPIEAANKILGMGHNMSVPPAMYSQHHQVFGQAVTQHLSKRSQGQIANRRIITLLRLNC